MQDLILSVRNGVIMFNAISPKAEEWCLLYTADRPIEYTTEREFLAFKWKAEADGLKVFVNR